MKIFILFFILFSQVLFAEDLNNLLKEYEVESQNSLQTIDEKLGHVFIYSQKDIKRMQYNKLNDILKELPLNNSNKNRLGMPNLSLSGTKTAVSGFFRFFINDHEISSTYTQSISVNWGDLPLDFVDHIEVYHGDSSFALGNETGIYFIRIYTKSARKENASQIQFRNSNKNEYAQSITHSESFGNDWSYLIYLNNTKKDESIKYENNTLNNDKKRRYLFLDINNEDTNINIAYTDIKKDIYMGLSKNANPDDGYLNSKGFYIDIKKYFLYDNSLKATFSIDLMDREYYEKNDNGIVLTPIFTNPVTLPKQVDEKARFRKINAYLGKTTEYKNNKFLTAISLKNKKYDLKYRNIVDHTNTTIEQNEYTNFNEETNLSLLLEDEYRVNDKILLVANAKIDKYKRNGYLKDFTEKLFRVGTIFTPTNNFGLKSFYTHTYVPPTFYNVDYAKRSEPNLEIQKYKIFTVEGVYTSGKSKFTTIYHDVSIQDFLYYTPVGFENIKHKIKTNGMIFNYKYLFNENNELQLNYYFTNLSEEINNSNDGGFIKYMAKDGEFEYFTSLIYKNKYSYKGLNVRASYDLNLGVTYNHTKDLSFSIRGENLLDKSSKSLYSDNFPESSFALEDDDRNVTMTVKWVF